MIVVRIFGKKNCDACKSTKQKFDLFLEKWEAKANVDMQFYDLDTVEGLTEAAMLDATDAPTTIIEKDGVEVARWQGKVPLSQEFKTIFA